MLTPAQIRALRQRPGVSQRAALELRRRQAETAPVHGVALLQALEETRRVRALIAPAQQALRELPYSDDGGEVEENAREYQVDLIGWQLNRAADLAEKRLAHLATLTTRAAIEEEKKLCAADVWHWFEYYAWGRDPRPDAPLTFMPFGLFPFQEKFVEWLNYLTFDKRTSGVVPKARDMGATETALRWALHNWLYREGFSALLLSANEDLVDSKGNPDTLFGKLRWQLRMLPTWMLPEGFSLDKDMTYMSLANPANGAVLQGEAPTDNVGRQYRCTIILLDEFAAWRNGGFAQHTSLSQTAKTQVAISSVQGENNKFADLCKDNRTARFEMDWRDHIWKDERWFAALPFGYVGPAMDEQQIAQEIERNFQASQPGQVFTAWREEYCLITWDELLAFYGRHGLADNFNRGGQSVIPEDWNWGRMFDYGQTRGHEWGFGIMARPRANYPLADSVFVFCAELIEPLGATDDEGVKWMRMRETELGLRTQGGRLRRPALSKCSHEQEELRAVLLRDYGENWAAWQTDYYNGISNIQAWCGLRDKTQPHPFYPELMGRPRIYFVAPSGEYNLAFNERTAAYFITTSKTARGFRQLRLEMPRYHYPREERGKPLKAMRPEKKFDNVIDVLRGFACEWGPIAQPLTEAEKHEALLPMALRPAALANIEDPERRGMQLVAQSRKLQQIQAAARNISSRRQGLQARRKAAKDSLE
jgi:hypothetical protein